jgi:hypothetical protein
LICNVYTSYISDEVQSLLKALVQFHFDKQASELQQKFSDILSDIEKSIPDIWNDETNDNSNQPVSYFTSTCIYITKFSLKTGIFRKYPSQT